MSEKLGAAAQVMAGLTEALTYDDILLVPRHSKVLPSKVDVASRLAAHPAQRPHPLRGDGHGHREPAGDRDGPARWSRRHSQEPVA